MNNITILKDVPYGENERHRIDIYIPESPIKKSGFLLIVHGGGWQSGDKTVHTQDCEYWSGRGYICGTMNYRYVSEDVSIFGELDDITSALKTAKEKCADYGFDISELILSGGSAGAHLCLMYAYLRAEESPVKPVAAFVYCPPVDCSKDDFLMGASGEFEDWKYEIMSKCCGMKITKENYGSDTAQTALKRISPISYVDEKSIPVTVCHGRQDRLVPYSQALEFGDVLQRDGVRHGLITYENSGHELDKDPETDAEAKAAAEDFLKDYFTK